MYGLSSIVGRLKSFAGRIKLTSNTTFQGNIIPSDTNTYDIGSSAKAWRTVYTRQLYLADSNTFFKKYIGGATDNDVEIQFEDGQAYMYYDKSAKQYDLVLDSQQGFTIDSTNMTFGKHLIPGTTGAKTLGSTNFNWKNICLNDRGTSETGYNIIITNGTKPTIQNGSNNIVLGNNGVANSLTTENCNVIISNTSNGTSFINGASETTAVGCSALLNNVSGTSSSAFGRNSLRSNTTGINNTGLGTSSLYDNTIGQGNVAVGYMSPGNTNQVTQNYNSFLGYDCRLASNTITESLTLGYKAIAQANYHTQLGERSVKGTGYMSYRTQDVIKESWIGTGTTILTNDNDGHNVKSSIALPTTATISDTFSIGTNDSSAITLTAKSFNSTVTLTIPAWNITGTASGGTATFGTALASAYRPTQVQYFVVYGYSSGNSVTMILYVDTDGSIYYALENGTDLVESAGGYAVTITYNITS